LPQQEGPSAVESQGKIRLPLQWLQAICLLLGVSHCLQEDSAYLHPGVPSAKGQDHLSKNIERPSNSNIGTGIDDLPGLLDYSEHNSEAFQQALPQQP
jgi:hypothetical protein